MQLYALVHLAQWQTVQPYVENANQAWQAAAAAYSAHAVLNTLFPWRYARFDAVLKPWVQQTSLTPDQLALARKVARSVALKLVASRLDDGFAQYRAFVPAPANGPVGAYQFVPAQTSSLYPQLAKARTFVLSNLSAVRGATPWVSPSVSAQSSGAPALHRSVVRHTPKPRALTHPAHAARALSCSSPPPRTPSPRPPTPPT